MSVSPSPVPAPPARQQVVRAAISDFVSVVVFALLAALAHGKGPADIAKLLAIFVPALAVAWLAARAWRAPASLKPVGLSVWAATSAVGLGIYAVVQSKAPHWTMTTITVVVLALLILGWRLLARAAAKSAQAE
ncbi:hypothetical protein GCM10010401_00620 [Rarobacter faecitabidus]|uniref:DUF3054 family protein n=1 Tax=Rarobacter faecitabidus TaxID=13243 RepID=A0A542ZWS3_RARFA|nr:DUF3054 family protein [Rarobacter faecitabidus]TQL64798.1 DUF3054 family protein [Rarobacter faecitabidus]